MVRRSWVWMLLLGCRASSDADKDTDAVADTDTTPACDPVVAWVDADGDGHGGTEQVERCPEALEPQHVDNSDDCDDTRVEVHSATASTPTAGVDTDRTDDSATLPHRPSTVCSTSAGTSRLPSRPTRTTPCSCTTTSCTGGTGPAGDLCAWMAVPMGLRDQWVHIAATLEPTGPIRGYKSLFVNGELQATCHYDERGEASPSFDLVVGAALHPVGLPLDGCWDRDHGCFGPWQRRHLHRGRDVARRVTLRPVSQGTQLT